MEAEILSGEIGISCAREDHSSLIVEVIKQASNRIDEFELHIDNPSECRSIIVRNTADTGKPSKVILRSIRVLHAENKDLKTEQYIPPVQRTVCWGTREEASRLGVPDQGTRQWAYRWIEEHVKSLAPVRTIVDIGGGGCESVLPNLLSNFAEQIIVVDRMCEGENRKKNITRMITDLNSDTLAIESDSVDIVVSASALEHLTKEGQLHSFKEIQRILRPGGVFCGTVSYVTGLSEEVLALLEKDMGYECVGSPISCKLDIKELLNAVPELAPLFAPVSYECIPGYDGFREEFLLNSASLVFDILGSYGDVTFPSAFDELRLKCFELGLYLVKKD